jgi:DNA-binding SARP family transcriptional activator
VGDGTASALHIQLLGGFAVRRGGVTIIDDSWSRRRAAALVKLLALQPERALHREQVFDALWPDLAPGAAANNLHKSVFYLREACEECQHAPPIVTTGGGLVSLDPGAVVDVEVFRRAARRARELRTDIEAHQLALKLYAGELLPSDSYEAWVTAARHELCGTHRSLALATARLCELRSEWASAVDALMRVSGDATDEEALRALMRALALAGDREAAIRAFERARDALRADLDVDPSPATLALHARIVAGQLRGSRTAHVAEEQLVGRETEVAQLVSALGGAANGAGGLALIGGEPGIGKTRLAEELVAHAHLRDARVLWGRCDQSDAVPAYWPWVQALRGFSDDGATEHGADFAGMIAGDGTRGTLGDPRPEQGRFRLFDAVTTFLRRAARERPILLVLDDLHEADVASLQLLRHVARESGSMPLLIVGTYRDVELTPEHPLTAMLGELVRERLKARIVLSGLDRRQVAQFVEATSGLAPASAVVALLHHETEGNPFFLKQCTLMLDEEGERRALRSGQLSVPPNVRDAIARRLAKLSQDCRETLEAAAVAGQSFDLSLLRRSTRAPASKLLDLLREATSARIVRCDADAPDAYSFWHGLIRQSLYEGMTARRRAALHKRTAQALESLPDADARVSELAYHYGEASLGDEAIEKAITYGIEAGEQALAVYAWEQALRHWEVARRLLEQRGNDAETLADLLERMPVVIANIGDDLPRGIQHLERAIALREGLGQRERAAEDHSRLGIALSMHLGDTLQASSTDLARALEHYRAAEPVIGGGPDRPAVAMFYAGLATVAFSAVRVPDGIAASQRAMEVADRLGMKGVLATASLLAGGILKLAGRLTESVALLEKAYALADEANDHNVAFYTTTNLADWTEGYAAGRGELLQQELSRPRNATPSVQRTTLINDIGCALARNGRLAEARAQLETVRADFLRTTLSFYDGEWDEVEANLLNGLDMLRQVGNLSSLANRLDHLAALYLVRDDNTQAAAMLAEELAIGLEGGSPLIEVRARAELALIASLAGDDAVATRHIDRCRAIMANGEDWGRKAGRLEIAAGVAATLGGRAGEGASCFDRAMAIFGTRVLPWDGAETYVRWARALEDIGDADAGAAHRDRAVDIYNRIGAADAWIARARSAGARAAAGA